VNKKFFSKYKLDSFLITDLKNIRYYSNFSGSNAQILITKKNRYFLTDSRYQEQVEYEISKNFKIIIYKKIEDSLMDIIEKEFIENIGFESKNLSYYNVENYKNKLKVEMVPLTDIVEEYRARKKKYEITKIKKAVKIAEKSLKNVKDYISQNITEKKFAALLEFEMLGNGAEDKAFPTIVASGIRGSIIHGKASNNKISRDSAVLIDFGCVADGYCSDKTVTIIMNKSCNNLKNVYNIVKDAKNFAIENIKPGKYAKDIDKIARDYIEKKGFGKYFLHSLGHGVGLDVHEKPTLSPLSEDILEQGMVITVEPGIYISGEFGVRLEDMVHITENGAEIITTLAEDFECLQE